MAKYLPRLQYLLLDQNELAKRTDLGKLKNLAAAVVRLEHPESEAAILAIIDELNEWLESEPELRRLFAIAIRSLLLRRNKGAWALPKVEDLKELRMGLAEKVERWAKEHEQRGEQRGRAEGLQAGRQEGLEKGLQEGLAKGLNRACKKARRKAPSRPGP